jgi:hypothetical protein
VTLEVFCYLVESLAQQHRQLARCISKEVLADGAFAAREQSDAPAAPFISFFGRSAMKVLKVQFQIGGRIHPRGIACRPLKSS